MLRRKEKKDEVVPPATAPPLPAYVNAPHPLLKLQRAAGNQAVQSLIETPGKTSDPYTRSFLASRFQDFGTQRTRPEDQAAENVEPRAFTVRDDANAAQLSPQEREGQKLLAHELAHVAQQTGAIGPQPAPPVDSPAEKTSKEESKKEDKTQAEAAKGQAQPAKAAAQTAIEEAKSEAGKTRDDVQSPAGKSAPKDKAAAEEEPEEGAAAEKKPGKDAKDEKEPSAEAEDGGPMEASAWRARVSRRVAGVPVPHLASGTSAPAKIKQTGQAITKGHGAARGGMGQGAQAAVPESPVVKDPVPVEPDPVPIAAEMVKKAAEAKLPDQRIPALLTTPLQTVPTMKPPDPPPPPKEDDKIVKKEADKAAGKKEAEKAKKKPAKAKKEVAKKPDEKKEKEEGKPLDPLLLKDEGLPKPQPFPPVFKTDLGKVLAQLLANTRKEAEAIINETRKTAYPGGKLQSVYPDIGKDFITDVEPALTKELRAIGAEAGIVDKELDKKIEERRQELKAQEAKAKGEIVKTSEDVKKDVKKEGQKKNDAAASEKKKQDKHADKKVEVVKDANDPEVVKGQRDRQIQRTESIVAQGSLNLKKAGDLREALLSRNEMLIINAYKRADQTDQEKIKAEPQKYLPLASGMSLMWLNQRIRETNAEFRRLKKEAADKTTENMLNLNTAGMETHKLIRQWANEKLGVRQNWWEELMTQVTDWAAQVKATTAVWEKQQNQDNRDEIARDLLQVDSLVKFVGENVDLETIDKRRDLTAEQKAIVKTYLTPGPEARNPISAVAAGLRVRIAQQKRKDLVDRMEKELLAKPDSEWRNLDKICQAERPGFQAFSIISQLWNAMDQWGTDEDAVYGALASLSTLGGATVRKAYRAVHHRDLEGHIRDEFSGKEKTRALALLEGKQAVADAAALYEAMEGGITGWGTDEATIYKTLRNKSAEEREAIAAEYYRISGRKLETVLDDELSGHELDRSDALMEGNTAKADAIGIDAAMRGGITGWGTEESEIEEIYKNIRQEVAAAHPDWTSEQVSAEVARRNQEVEVEFNAKYAKDYGSPEGSALRKAFSEEMQGPELDLANAMADDDLVAADAARIAIEAQSVFYTSDDAVNTVLQGQYERAIEDLRRDVLPGKKKKLQEEIERRRKEGKPMTADEIAAANRKIEREIEELAKVKGKKNMDALEQRFDSKYSATYVSGETGKSQYGGLKAVINMNLSGEDRKKAGDLLAQGGYLTPVQQIDYAVTGPGTDEDGLKKALKGRTKEEIAQIRKAWEEKHPGQSMDARIKSELDGRDLFDVGELLVGEPTNAKERMEQLNRRHFYEKNAYLLGNALAGHEERVMDEEYEEAKRRYAKLTDPNSQLSIEEKNELQSDFELQATYSDIAAEDFRKGVDRVTDQVTQIAGAVAAIVVTVVILVASGGTAAPLLVALAASLAGSLATMTSKLLILGSAYGMEDFGIDVALLVVDAAVSAATAGMGDKLLKAAKGVPPGMIARMAQSGSKVTKVLARGLAEGAENLLQAAPNALAANVLNDKNWQGDAFKNILTGTVSQTAMGVGMGVGMSFGMGKAIDLGGKAFSFAGDALSKLRGPKLDVPNIDAVPTSALVEGGEKVVGKAGRATPDTPHVTGEEIAPPEVSPVTSATDPHAHLGTPAERKAGFFSFKESNPDLEYDDYLKALNDSTISRTIDPDAAVKVEQKLRKEVLLGLPADQRKHFDDVPVKVVSDAEFVSTTRSNKGQAVVMIENGKPVIIMRESADPKVLREEGVHLGQLLDPRTAAKVHKLDERHLANWDNLSLTEKLSLYRTKIELELDGQQRLLKGLADDLADAGDNPQLKQALGKQIKEAEQTLDNLSKRLGDVDNILPEQRIRIAQGLDTEPDFLDQPPRLFSKKDTPDLKPIKNSPKSKDGNSTFQVGDEWPETKRLDGGKTEVRTYRRVKVVEPDGTVSYRQEILKKDGKWVRRGKEAQEAGELMEEASEAMTKEQVVPEAAKRGEKYVPANVQNESGQGFDEVIFKMSYERDAKGQIKLDRSGNPKMDVRVGLVEVKDYPNRNLSLKDFTAVFQNIKQNLDDLSLRVDKDFAKMGLTRFEADQIIKAIDQRKLDIDIRLGPETSMGTRESGTILTDLQAKLRQKLHSSNIDVPNFKTIDPTIVNRFKAAETIEDLAGKNANKAARLTDLSDVPAGRSPSSVKQAQSALLAEGKGFTAPVQRGAPGGAQFHDKSGRPFDVLNPVSTKRPPLDVNKMANDINTRLRDSVKVPGKRGQAPMNVVINTADIKPADLKKLKEKLRAIAKKQGDSEFLTRITYVP
ncbi:MAG TPA: DUF4157 domain-containing protein [Pyrinomonadaceae bacterium]